MIVTFYSFKGGVGRSMAMANVAEILAQLGYHVVVCDWDLEAPGLERYLTDDASETEALRAWPGIVDLLQEYKDAASRVASESDREPADDVAFQTFGSLRLRRPSSYARAMPPPAERRDGSIRLLSAGRRDGPWNARYTEAVRGFDWKDFYAAWAGTPTSTSSGRT